MARSTQYTLYSTYRTDPTFGNIWAFMNENERNAFLNNKVAKVCLNQKYWRVGSTIKVECTYEQAMKYDYVRIVNDLGTANAQTYYCFVTSRTYISRNVTLLVLELDYVQTWYFTTLADGGKEPFWNVTGFVKKMTSRNYEPRRGTPADYPVPKRDVYNLQFPANSFGLVIYSSVDIQSSQFPQRFVEIQGVCMTNCPYVIFGSTYTATLQAYGNIINNLNQLGKIDVISNVCVIPSWAIPDNCKDGQPHLMLQTNKRTVEIPQPLLTGNYQPKYTVVTGYDYTYFTVNNNQGDTALYHFEDFDGSPKFQESVSINSGTVEIHTRPLNLKNTSADAWRQHGMKFTGVPLCTFNNDTYKIWLAQTSNSRHAAIDAANHEIANMEAIRSANLGYQLSSRGTGLLEKVMNITGTTVSKALWAVDKGNQAYEAMTSNPLQNIVNNFTGMANEKYMALRAKPLEMPGTLNPNSGNFGGGESRGGGYGVSFGGTGTQNLASSINSAMNSGSPSSVAKGLIGAYMYKELGMEQVATLDAGVQRAQDSLNTLMATYADKEAIPPTARGSNACGSMTNFNQVGFFYTVVTPTAEYGKLIDEMLSASGLTVNEYQLVKRNNVTFDFYSVNSAHIEQDYNARPSYVCNILKGLLDSGVYLWYCNSGSISPYFGQPYGVINNKYTQS